MSKYGPAWVWPAASGAPDKPLPSKPSAEGESSHSRHRRLPTPADSRGPCRVRELVRQVCMAARTSQNHGEAPRKARWGHKLRKRKNQLPWGPPRPGIYPSARGLRCNLDTWGGRAHQ